MSNKKCGKFHEHNKCTSKHYQFIVFDDSISTNTTSSATINGFDLIKNDWAVQWQEAQLKRYEHTNKKIIFNRKKIKSNWKMLHTLYWLVVWWWWMYLCCNSGYAVKIYNVWIYIATKKAKNETFILFHFFLLN